MEYYQWKSKIKKVCIEAGVYEPYCDRYIAELADLMYMLQDFKADYEEAKAKNNFDKKRECAIRKTDLHKACRLFWQDLMLTPKDYRAFIENNMEIKKENKLLALIREDNNVPSE